MTGIDHDLRELFARLREEDRARAPSFDAVRVSRAGRHPRPGWAPRLIASAAAVAIVVAAIALVEHGRSTSSRESTRSHSHPQPLAGLTWAFPTDFLLNTPGSRLLREVPTFGAAHWIRSDSTPLRPRIRS